MAKAQKIILRLSSSSEALLGPFIEKCLDDGVQLIAVVGENSRHVEDVIDTLIMGDGSDPDRFIVTTSHPNESLDDVVHFVTTSYVEGDGGVRFVEL